jgi:hypothetical protein
MERKTFLGAQNSPLKTRSDGVIVDLHTSLNAKGAAKQTIIIRRNERVRKSSGAAAARSLSLY